MYSELTFKDILVARSEGLESLNEASLHRAHQHAEKQGHNSFGIVTAHRADASPKENKKNMKELKDHLRSLGHGYIRMKGHWDGNAEPSLFVPGLSRHHAEKIRHKYDQDAVIHKGPESDHAVHLLTRDGDSHDLGKFHPHKIAHAYSSIKGKPFSFEWIANSAAEALLESVYKIKGRV